LEVDALESIVIGAVGAQIELITGQDLTGATVLEMHVLKPDGSADTWTATPSATAGSITYTTSVGDLDLVGVWKISSYVEWGSSSKHESPDPYELLVVAAGTNKITTTEIRDAINIPRAGELSEVAINSAILRAFKYFQVLKARYAAPAEFFPDAEMAYAVYLAYQTYADRVLNEVPGSYQEGKWDPIAEEIVRSTSDKLRGLKEVYEDYTNIIKEYPKRPMGTFLSSTPGTRRFSVGQFDYPTGQSTY
jgi:hypothetical protein